ncbi:hypothetical protein GCM10023100_05940 [Actinocorallia cavernae]|uniref:Uncharacterized protein n=2 Tax=Actinomycetes TaxID=1760 RepID=A0ABP8SAS4_9ACTN
MPDSPTPPAEQDMAQTPPALPDAETRFQAPKSDADVLRGRRTEAAA